MGGWVDTILQGVFVFVGIIMTFFILLQEGKGGGLAALGGTKAAGVEGVTNPIRRATAYLAGLFFLLAIILGILHKPRATIGLGMSEAPAPVVAPAVAPASADAPMKIDLKPVDAAKPADAPKTDAPKTDAVKPADAKTDAKPAEGAVKPAETPKVEAPKTDALKPVEAPKTDAPKPADAPKTDK